MAALQGISRLFLVAVNIFFLIIGLVFFALGLFMRFGEAILNDYVDSVKTDLEATASSSGVGVLDLSQFNITELLFGISLGFIFFGLLLIIITLLGCVGACCKKKVLLLVYVIVCGVLLLAQIIVIGVLYGSPDTFHEPAKTKLKEKIQADYQGLTGNNVVSIGWNIIMQKIECCGVDSFADFTGAPNWNTTYYIYTLATPLACCRTLPSSANLSCAANGTVTESNNYMNEGCYDAIWDMTLGKPSIMIPVVVVVAVFQVPLLLFGLYLVLQRNNKTGATGSKAPLPRNNLSTY